MGFRKFVCVKYEGSSTHFQGGLAMKKFTLCGCDLHDKSMLLKIACDRDTAQKRSYENTPEGRRAMIAELQRRAAAAGGTQILFAYEASGQGFGLYDELQAVGITCHVLAPTKMECSAKQRSSKTDERDAEQVLEVLRGHYLAGNELPAVWVPDAQTRDDRELVRARLDAQQKCNLVKNQIRALLKRHEVRKPKTAGGLWGKVYRQWLLALSQCDEPLQHGARQALASLLRQLQHLEEEVVLLDKQLMELSQSERYSHKLQQLVKEFKGVGLLTALVFLTELGHLGRFHNRRQLGGFWGLTPSSNESGETDDRKGHITHQGPPRVRYVLCQAVWNRVRFDPRERAVYERIAAKNPKHKKIAVVAAMRRLGVQMWHAASRARVEGQGT
jgi:transposase